MCIRDSLTNFRFFGFILHQNYEQFNHRKRGISHVLHPRTDRPRQPSRPYFFPAITGRAAYPVSYTHLDVYKRQVTQLAEPTEQEIRQMREEIEEAKKEKSRAYHRPVSYTHLVRWQGQYRHAAFDD